MVLSLFQLQDDTDVLANDPAARGEQNLNADVVQPGWYNFWSGPGEPESSTSEDQEPGIEERIDEARRRFKVNEPCPLSHYQKVKLQRLQEYHGHVEDEDTSAYATLNDEEFVVEADSEGKYHMHSVRTHVSTVPHLSPPFTAPTKHPLTRPCGRWGRRAPATWTRLCWRASQSAWTTTRAPLKVLPR